MLSSKRPLKLEKSELHGLYNFRASKLSSLIKELVIISVKPNNFKDNLDFLVNISFGDTIT